MKEYQLGEFEEIVLLTVGVLYDEAYGVAIKEYIEEKASRKVSVGALQSALRRMEKKGYLVSRTGAPNTIRGGKPKRFFKMTTHGKNALEHNKSLRTQLFNAIPKIAFNTDI